MWGAEPGEQKIEDDARKADEILVLHHDRTLLESIGDVLDHAGYAVATARVPDRVPELLAGSPPEIIIAENSKETTSLRAALRRDPAWSQVSFIILIDDHAVSTPRKFKNTGADMFLTKPFDAEDLVAAVEMLLGRSHYAASKANLDWTHNLLTAVGEEIRAPLTHVYGYTHLLNEYHGDLDRREVQDILHVMLHGTERIAQMVEDVMLITRLESGLAAADAASFQADRSLRSLVSAVVDEVRDLSDQGPDFLIEISEDLRVSCVPFYLRHALQRVLLGAIQLSDSQAKPIVIRAGRENGSASLSVAIDGFSLPPDQASRLFTPLRALDPRERDRLGIRLGFAIAASLIELMRGQIAVPDPARITLSLPGAKSSNHR